MKATIVIVTRYTGPTDTKPAMVRASVEGCKPVSVPLSLGGSADDGHKRAVLSLCQRNGWNVESIEKADRGPVANGYTFIVKVA